MDLFNRLYFSMRDATMVVVNRFLAVMLVMLCVSVAIPLTMRTYLQGGGPWGFGIVGLHVLLPLDGYLLFAIAAFMMDAKKQWILFIVAQLVTLCLAILSFFNSPLFPVYFLLFPALLAFISIRDTRRLQYYLGLMILLAILINLLLLKWEVDFGRTVPLFEIVSPVERGEP